MRSNCVLEAWREYRKLRREWVEAGCPHGGEPYIWIRSSRLSADWIPHTGVAQNVDGRWVMRSFKPVNKNKLRCWQLWRVVIFVGQWVEGDTH